ncbi:MAG TPA: zinc ribbon domain-containing protein, partial [Candidatus Angelobacter sp.]|nr:zinc ribbon domain-containing protein [Candidatus Angelobacter sp.]
MALCTSCGSEVADAASFCTSCGQRMPSSHAGSTITVARPVCSACGAQVDLGSVFCTHCGQRMVQPAVTEETAPISSGPPLIVAT